MLRHKGEVSSASGTTGGLLPAGRAGALQAGWERPWAGATGRDARGMPPGAAQGATTCSRALGLVLICSHGSGSSRCA